ncbi:efflux RND transporter permease subunit [Synechococcus sp. W4D4]|uniref:efflux RND transporter permease subunit n=1 Tax=Synechococcus sp. W4D4 TaxID=3392294 RepID=UPI0039E7E55C
MTPPRRTLSDLFLRRPVFSLVLSLLLLLMGALSLSGLQVENLPSIAPGRVSVRSSYPGGSPEVVEQGVTALIEQQLNGLERLESIRSSSSGSGSSIQLNFRGGSPELNQVNTQNEIAQVLRRLPAQVARLGVQVRRSSDDLLMILSFSADPQRYTPQFLNGWVSQVVQQRLQRVEGVGDVRLFGGSPLAFRLWLNPAALLERQLTINDVERALQAQNVLAALGQTGEAPMPPGQATTLPLEMEGRLRSRAELEQLVVGEGPEGGVVLLSDIGRVSLGSESYDAVATNLQGRSAVAIGVYQRDGTNALAVSESVEQALEELQPDIPPGIDLQLIVNEAETIRTSIGETAGSLRDAVLLVFLALLLGLGNSRLALISALAVPVSLLGSITLIKLAGGSINTLSLFGMVLASGLVVDDAIVVSEDIGRRLEAGASPLAAARESMAELGGAVVATSLVLVVVFLPVIGLEGSVGRLYAPIAISISAAIAVSTFNAISFTPVAASRLLHAEQREPAWLLRWIDPPRRWLESLEEPYSRWLEGSLKLRRRVMASVLVGLLVTALGLSWRPTAFIPQEDNGQLRGVVVLPEGLSLQRTEAVMTQVLQLASADPAIRTGNFYAGRSFGDSTPNKGLLFLRLKPIGERGPGRPSTEAVAKRLNRLLRQQISGATVIVSQAPSVRGFSSEGGLELELLDTSNGQLSLQQFAGEAQRLIQAANATGLFERVSTRFSADSPLLRLEPDRLQMASLGVELSQLVSTLQASLGSSYVNDSFEGDQVRRVIVQLDGSGRRNLDDVLALQVRSKTGALIPVGQLVQVEASSGASTINHSRLVRSISIRALPASGVSTGQAMAELERLQQQLGGRSTDLAWRGLAEEERRSGGSTFRVFALAVFVMGLVLAGLYENLLDPFIILITVPLALLGALGGLVLRGLPLDVYGQMGLLVLVALAAKNGILIVEFANQRLREGLNLDQAIRESARSRLRPILLTAISSLAGFLPLLLASGSSASSRISIGTVVFFGLLVATVLSLFVVPSSYRLIKGWELQLKARRTHA